MNLSEMDDADAKRLVDFAAGLTFGLHGRIERVTAKVFLLSPHNVTVTAQDKARIENGFFNQSLKRLSRRRPGTIDGARSLVCVRPHSRTTCR